jgi:hypothetical protein
MYTFSEKQLFSWLFKQDLSYMKNIAIGFHQSYLTRLLFKIHIHYNLFSTFEKFFGQCVEVVGKAGQS